ncbi:MAG: AAA family ATPase, partial [Pseudomonadota bacterium]
MTYPYLTRVRLENYKNLNGREWLALNQLNILIGPNGAGKSNFIAGLRFLKESVIAGVDALGRDVTGLQAGLDGVGGIKIIDDMLQRPSHTYLQFEFNETEAMPQGSIFELDLHAPDDRPQIFIHEECLRAAQTRSGNLQPFYYYKCHDRRSGEGVVSVYNESGEGSHFEAIRDVPIDELSFNCITRLLEDSQVPPERTPVYKVRRHLRDTILAWRFYNSNDMSFKRIREADPRMIETATALAPNG